MVCIPCIVVPVLLFIWHRFIRPFVAKFWDPFGSGKKIQATNEDSKNIKEDSSSSSILKDAKCPFSTSSEKNNTDLGEAENLDSKKTNTSKDSEIGNGFGKQENETKELSKKQLFPSTLKEFGYHFKDGQLRNILTDESFQFVVKEDDHDYNQKNYEALGAVVTEEVYNLLEQRCGLQKNTIPIDAAKDEPSTFIFTSKDYSCQDKLLILIHGSGRVRAGQWAQRLIINDSLDSGTQIPFIEKGIKEGYGIIVMNTNDNSAAINGTKKMIKVSKDPADHGEYVWTNFVRPSQSNKIFIVAHSFGGIVATQLFSSFEEDFMNRVVGVAMTDSVHYFSNSSKFENLIEISRNWVTSKYPLDTPISRRSKDVPSVSAGCEKHELTSWSSFESIFKFFNERLVLSEALSCESSNSRKKAKLESDFPPPSSPKLDEETAHKL